MTSTTFSVLQVDMHFASWWTNSSIGRGTAVVRNDPPALSCPLKTWYPEICQEVAEYRPPLHMHTISAMNGQTFRLPVDASLGIVERTQELKTFTSISRFLQMISDAQLRPNVSINVCREYMHERGFDLQERGKTSPESIDQVNRWTCIKGRGILL